MKTKTKVSILLAEIVMFSIILLVKRIFGFDDAILLMLVCLSGDIMVASMKIREKRSLNE